MRIDALLVTSFAAYPMVQSALFHYDATKRNFLNSKEHCENQGWTIASIHSDHEQSLATDSIPCDGSNCVTAVRALPPS